MQSEHMNSYERVMAVLNGKKPDRLPVINPTSIATLESMDICGAHFPEAHNNAEQMAALAAVGHDVLGFDSVEPYFGVQNEAAALGAVIDWGARDEMPKQRRHVLDLEDVSDFEIPEDYLDRLPVRTVVNAIGILKEKYGDTVAVMGKVMGPWTLSYNLAGTQEFLMETIEEPELVETALRKFKELALQFALAQVRAGADIITWCDHATGNLVSAEMYERFLLPVQTEMVGRFHEETKKITDRYVPLFLHCCGKATDRLHLFKRAGFDAFHFDSVNDIGEMMRIAGDDILLTGCVNNPRVLLQGSPAVVEQQVTRIVEGGVKLISPECAVPTKVPNENLITVVKTVKRLTLE